MQDDTIDLSMSLIENLRVLPPMPLVPKKLENDEIARIKHSVRCIAQKVYIEKVKGSVLGT